jgi:hypothetical protein
MLEFIAKVWLTSLVAAAIGLAVVGMCADPGLRIPFGILVAFIMTVWSVAYLAKD